MKVAILAGGLGTRLLEETVEKPKALVSIGELPILWHLMRYYASFGFTEFVVALGYKGQMICDFFASRGRIRGGNGAAEPEAVTVEVDGMTVTTVDTGPDTETGGRIKRLRPYLDEETFMLTWCDGLADVDLTALRDFHRSHGNLATLTAIHPKPRFGHLSLDGDAVAAFAEKPERSDEWINGAFFVLEPGIFDYIDGDETEWDRVCLTAMARDGRLMAYRHEAFWQCMDTLKERQTLEELWNSDAAPWKTWS